MKKKVCIISSVLLVMCVLFSSCVNSNYNSRGNGTERGNKGNDKVEDVIIEKKDFSQYFETIELTTDNWKDYFEIVKEEKTSTQKDDFGEIIATTVTTTYVLSVKNRGQFIGDSMDVKIELNNVKDGSTNVYGCGDTLFSNIMEPIKEIYTIDDYVCTRIKGKLIFVMDIPQHYIQTNNKGNDFIEVYQVEGKDKQIVAGDALKTRYYKGSFDEGIDLNTYLK